MNMEIKEPISVYYSRPQGASLKKKVIASIEKEEDMEVLLQYVSVMQQKRTIDEKYDEGHFTKLEEELGCLKDVSMPCCFTEED